MKLEEYPIGDDGMGFDESQDQEDYMTYSTYLSMVESGSTEERAMELLRLTQKDIDAFIDKFEPKEDDLEEEEEK
ncbi:hypothetical protein MASR1M31_02210 [Porphyromonadaceae bacterium]